MSDTQLGTNTRKKISAGGVIGIIAGAAVVVAAAVLAVVLLYQGGIASQPEQTDDITGFEQLQAALADPDDRTLTLNTDLESTGTLTVVGRKSLTGTGKLTVKLGGSSTYAVFEVTNGADLTLEGITIEGSVTADGVNVHSGAKATLKNVAIYWPYQYGVYADGEAVLENVNIDNALTAAVQASEGTVTVRGGKLTNSQSLAVYLHNNGTVILDGNVVIDGSNKHGITNRGKLTVSEATIENCDQYGIVNYGRLTVGNGSADAVCIGKNGNGAIYNYAGGRVEARDLKLYESGHSAISNNGEMTLSDSRIESSATNGVLNTAQMTATGLTITGSGNCGIYNRNPGDLKLNASVITDSDRRGVHNMGGTVELTDVTIDTCGTMGIANTVDGYGNAGKLTAVGTAVSGCNSNVYNEKAGVETTLIGCTLNKSKATNVVTSYGTMTLDNTRVLGSGNEGSYCVQVAKGAICTIKGGSVITGAASRGVTNHGTMTISGADVYGNNSHASGGGVYTDGTLYISGGCIHDNTATTSGGGIALGYSSTDPELVGKLYMTGGAIYANKATNNGGGIYVSKGVAYNEGGEIRNCYAEVTGGEIYGNSAGNVGSGMSVSGKAGLGGAAHFGAGNDIYLASGVVLEMAGLTAHNAADPLVINTAAKTGTVIAAADSEDAATKVLAAIRHGGVTGSFVRFGREIVVGESTYVPGDEIDMADAETVEVSTFLQLKEAVEGTPSGKKRVIRVTADIAMESTVTVPYGTVVQLTDPASAVTLRRAASMTSGYLFSVTPQAIFTLRGTAAARLTLDGNASVAVTGEDGALLYNRGVLMLETVTLQNANATQSYGGLLRSPSGVVSVKNAVLSGGYAKNGGAIFVSGGQMTLTDTTLTGNSSVASGGAIRYQGGTLVIEGGSFTGNSGTTGGAIIADTGVALKITDTSFQNNTTTGGHGGAVYLSGESSLVAVNAVFDGNTAGGSGSYYGGALGLNGASSATLTGCMFDGNAVTHEGNNNGGAVYVGGSSALTVTGGTFRNNRAYGDANANGGAIYGNSGTVTVEAASFENNSAKNGGAIYVIGYTLTVNSAAFSGNTTAVTGGGGGGALYAADSVDTVIRVADSTFTGNTAGTYGGVINVLKNGTVSFSDSAFTGNTARSGNDANTFMVSSDGVLTLRSVAVTPADAAAGDVRLQNRAVVNVGDACKLGLVKLAYTTARVHLLSALPEGAAMTLIPAEYTAGSQLVSEESAGLVAGSADRITVAANGAEKWMLDADGQLLPDQTTALIGQTRYDTPAAALAAAQSGETVTLIENVTSGTALTVPAGVTLDGGGKTLTADVALADTAHLENIAVSGGVTLDGDAELSTVTVSGTVTVAAGATLTAGGDFRTDTVALGAGAVIALDSALGDVSIKVTSANEAPGTVLLTGDAELVAAEFTKFRAVLTDGRLYIDQTGKIDLRPFRALIVGRDIEKDTLEEAVAAAQDGDVIAITNDCTVSAQIDITGKQLTLTSDGEAAFTVFRGSANTAAVFQIAADGGLTLTNITVDGGKFTATKALVENSGAFTLSADAVLRNGVNSAQAGALDNNNVTTAIAVVNGTVSDCQGVNGGAIRNYAKATLTVGDGAVFSGNTATGNGGAIHQSGKLTAGKATFTGNHSGQYGGAIFTNAAEASTAITGATFTGNYTDATATNNGGGALAAQASTPITLTDCAFTDNKAEGTKNQYGGAVRINTGVEMTLSGCTFTGNHAAAQGGAVWSAGTVTVTDGTFTENVAASQGGAVWSSGTATVQGSFTGNSTTGGGGGALLNSAGSMTITGGTFTGNSAGSVGGVLNTSGAAVVTVTGGSFTGNTAKTNGGAIHISGNGTLNLTGGTVNGNTDQNTPAVDIWLNNASTSKLDLTGAAAGTTLGTVGGKSGDNVTNPANIAFTDLRS